MTKVDTLFLDLGGVVLTNGWDHTQRFQAVNHFGLDWDDFQSRHEQIYHLCEVDQICFDDYLNQVVFWKKRDFTLDQFRLFAYALSQPHADMLDLITSLKSYYGFKVVVVSNEGRALADYRIKTFGLTSFVDQFFVSCYVHLQKPDPRIYRIALDVSQVSSDRVFYLDDRPKFIEAAAKLGINGLAHTALESTKQALLSFFG